MPAPHGRVETFVVADGARLRLDQFLVRHVAGCSRRMARLAVAAGGVLVNGRRGRKGQSVQPGDVVHLDRTSFDGELVPQDDLLLPVLYTDSAVVAVDKPSGMPAIALRANDLNTVANYLVARYPDMRGIGRSAFESGVAHRLDTATSGVLLGGRSSDAWHDLRRQFRERRVAKLYIAVVAGHVGRRGAIATPIAHRDSRRMSVCPDRATARRLRARPALTRYRPLRRLAAATLLAVRIPTGVRHQIRVHLASIGHPILGDALYGDAASAPRLLLHAARLGFAHPLDGRRLIVRSPLPADFQAALRS